MADIFSSFSRSWRLVKASIAVLNSDGELLALPLLSILATIGIGGALVWQVMDDGTVQAMQDGTATSNVIQGYYLWLFAFYVVEYFIIIFFNTALVGAAIERLEGGDPTLRSALGLALRRIGPIFGYAVISATVGLLLRFVSERAGILGRIVAGSAGLAWTVATFLVVPVLAAEGIGPIEAIEKSSALLRKSWGENLVGNAGISLVIGLVVMPFAFAFAYGMYTLDHGDMTVALVILTVSGMALAAAILVGTALTAIYAASVYYYATVGEPPSNFRGDLISGAFSRKGST